MFDVKHPPLVDLRNVNSITVIPLEWNKTGRYRNLTGRVTHALTQGVKRGDINFVDPNRLRFIPEQNYSQYVDVYITGRIINAGNTRNTETREEFYNHTNVTRIITTRTAFIRIEYSYIRAANKEVLGTFRKSGTSRTVSEEAINPNAGRRGRSPDPHQRQNPGQNRNPNDRQNPGQGRGQGQGPSQRPEQEQRQRERQTQRDNLMAAAITRFSDSMNQELSPWTTPERRKIRRVSGNKPQITQAGQFIRQRNYNGALDIYRNIFQINGCAAAAYNTAVLLQTNDKFTEALDFLLELNGKNRPGFLRREINKLERYTKGLEILEGYK